MSPPAEAGTIIARLYRTRPVLPRRTIRCSFRRHSFVSIMSAHGVRIATIADLVGHAGTRVTEWVCRLQLSPGFTQGKVRPDWLPATY